MPRTTHKPGAGRERYKKGVRWAIIDEDKAGDGFRYDQVYEILLNADGRPVEQAETSGLGLEGVLRVGYARILELRKWNGRVMHPRLGIARNNAARGMAVVLPFVRRSPWSPEHLASLFGDDSDTEEGAGGRWTVDRRRAAPLLVPLVSLGRLVQLAEDRAAPGQYTILSVSDVAGGPALRGCAITLEMFEADKMVGLVAKDLMEMKVAELKKELEARDAPKTARDKMALRVRLRALMIRAALDAHREEEGTGVFTNV